MKVIYLDNQATTQIDPIVVDEMAPYLNDKFGNSSSSSHIFGWESKEAVEIAKDRVAKLINAQPHEIYFTSGATESINIALKGTNPTHIITLNTEHTVTLDVCKHLKSKGCKISYISVPTNGIINQQYIKEMINEKTSMISIMHAHNEIGVIQPIEEIGNLCDKLGILFHVDAAQSTGKIPIDVNKMKIDLLSMSSHKMYGPKGVGALFIKRKIPKIIIEPLLHGGGQQNGIRPGTMPIANIVGFGKACQISCNNMDKDNKRIMIMRKYLLQKLQNNVPNIIVNGDLENRLSGNLNISFPNNNSEQIIMKIRDIALSNGSACTSKSTKSSHVLNAIGISNQLSRSSIRFGIGRFNTMDEIDYTINKIIEIINC